MRWPTTPIAASGGNSSSGMASECWALGAHLVGQAVCDRDRRAASGDLAGGSVGRRGGRRCEARRGGAYEGHCTGGCTIRRDAGERLYGLADLASPVLVSAERLRRDRARLRGVCRGVVADPRRVRCGGRPLRAGGAPGLRRSRTTSSRRRRRSPLWPTACVRHQSRPAPSHFAHQHLDTATFATQFADRIYHVHIKDSKKRLDGRRSILASHLNFGEQARLGLRVAGHGDVDFEALFRALNRHRLRRTALDRVGGLGDGSRVRRPGRSRFRTPHRLPRVEPGLRRCDAARRRRDSRVAAAECCAQVCTRVRSGVPVCLRDPQFRALRRSTA